jgi:hypothetical protein
LGGGISGYRRFRILGASQETQALAAAGEKLSL